MMKPLEVIVVGGGIAGMAYARHLAERSGDRAVRIRMLTKAPVQVSSSHAAQGGLAAVTGRHDSYEQHIRDTLAVGAGRNDRRVVELVVREGAALVRDLIGIGAEFDTGPEGELHLAREGGHSTARVVHRQDRTGAEIVRVLRDRVDRLGPVVQLDDHRVLELLVEGVGGERRCMGVRSLDLRSRVVTDLRADLVVLATGGAGQVYAHTTNPVSATGDGIAMALRAGVATRDMAFVQFHPTAMYGSTPGRKVLVSEAVRGAGARLVTLDGEPLMSGVHPMGDLAPRNVVARAIHAEIERSGVPYVLLDTAPIGRMRFLETFPAIYQACIERGITAGVDPIPVMPAAHYLCGGIRTDDHGRTELNGLFALGECACSGLHGADRLASNSLLEALVIPARAAAITWEAGRTVGEEEDRVVHERIPARAPESVGRALVALRHAMSTHVGVVRHQEGMICALRAIARGERMVAPLWGRRRWSLELIELRDLLTVARAITESALAEPQSVGSHYLDPEGAGGGSPDAEDLRVRSAQRNFPSYSAR